MLIDPSSKWILSKAKEFTIGLLLLTPLSIYEHRFMHVRTCASAERAVWTTKLPVYTSGFACVKKAAYETIYTHCCRLLSQHALRQPSCSGVFSHIHKRQEPFATPFINTCWRNKTRLNRYKTDIKKTAMKRRQIMISLVVDKIPTMGQYGSIIMLTVYHLLCSINLVESSKLSLNLSSLTSS